MAHNRSLRYTEIRRRRHRREKRLKLRRQLAMAKDEETKRKIREKLIALGAPPETIGAAD